MAHNEDDWPDKVTPLEQSRRRPVVRDAVAPVAALPGSEAGVLWRGDEEWVSTLADPHDASVQDESE